MRSVAALDSPEDRVSLSFLPNENALFQRLHVSMCRTRGMQNETGLCLVKLNRLS